MLTSETTVKTALQFVFTTIFILLFGGNLVWGQPPCYTGHAPNFSTKGGYTTGGDSDSGGSPTTTIRLASGGQPGSVLTTATGVTAGSVTVRFRAKGWSGSENSIIVTIDGQSVLYTGLTTTFAWHEIVFPGVSEDPVLSFSTTSGKRLHIGNVEIICALTGPSHDVIFNANGGTGTMANQTIAEGGSANLNSNTFTRAGYVFADWNTSADGSGTSYTDGASFTMGTGDVTLYAQWDVYVGPCVEENFGGIGSSGSYGTKTWTGDGGTWTATDAREDETINGKAIVIRNGELTSPQVSGGIGSLTVTTQLKFSGSNGNLNVFVNGVAVGTIPYSSTVGTFTISNINVAGDVIVVIENTNSNRVAIDDLSWTCYDPVPVCTPTASISSFLPTSGPAETVVTITGSGFNGATAVKFGTTDAISFTIIDDNTITAKVPHAITATENISVFDAGACETVSGGNFSKAVMTGSCSDYPGITDLFISEVYDHAPGNGWYLELYNPTDLPIVLDGTYEIERYGDLDLSGSHSVIPLEGTVAPMSTFIIQLHSDNVCSGLSIDFTTPGDHGINEDDRIRLVKSSIVVDDVSAPGNSGYSIIRDIDPSMVAPSPTYPTVGWTTTGHSCSDLGQFALPPSTAITVTDPNDVHELSTPASLSMNVTSAGGTNPTYQWYFHDPVTDSWMTVTPANLPGTLTVSGSNTENLVISGDVPDVDGINNYQFYCEVLDGTCEIPSDAALFTIENPLPVTLTSFQATCDEKSNQMHLFWNTASETNSSHFTVEKSRSMDHWTAVSTVQAAGNSNDNIAYQATDQNPWSGITYYRLKQYDFDGKMETFDPISMACVTGENAVKAYPNPSNGNFTTEITWQDASVQTQMQIMDVTGKIVVVQEVEIKKGVQKLNVNQAKLAIGTYLIVFPNTELKPLRIVINK